jgi:putative oxidoreductase
MANEFLSPAPLWANAGLTMIRITTGLLMAYHGWEVFDGIKIQEYASWEVVKKLLSPLFFVYTGKGVELVTGVCLAIGFFTRIASLFMAINMLFICFFIGQGKFYYEDQHPFIFALLAMVFFLMGPGALSLDRTFFTKQK